MLTATLTDPGWPYLVIMAAAIPGLDPICFKGALQLNIDRPWTPEYFWSNKCSWPPGPCAEFVFIIRRTILTEQMSKRYQIDLKRPGKKIRRDAKKTNEYPTSCISDRRSAPTVPLSLLQLPIFCLLWTGSIDRLVWFKFSCFSKKEKEKSSFCPLTLDATSLGLEGGQSFNFFFQNMFLICPLKI